MRSSLRSLPFLLLLAAGLGQGSALAAATPWALAACDPAGDARWRAVAGQVRAAQPRSTLYTPHPYPTTDAQVVADYLDRFRKMRQGSPGRVTPMPLPNDDKVVAVI